MPQVKPIVCLSALTAFWVLMSCNEQAGKASDTKTDTTTIVEQKDSATMPSYDAAMDPYLTSGDAIKKLHDTLGVKFYELIMEPGDTAMLHAHPDHAVYVLQGGQLAVSFQGGDRVVMDLKAGQSLIAPALSDAAKNVGKTTLKMLIADVYRPRGNGASSMPGYDPALDPLTVGAAFSKKLGDTLNIKMFETAVKPGQSFPLHTHPDHAIYVLQGGRASVVPQGQQAMQMDMVAGTGWVGGPLTDSAKNIGKTTIKIMEIDFYRPRPNQ